MKFRGYNYNVYMICPVRKATDKEKEFLKKYQQDLEAMGLRVCYPAESTNQKDDSGGYQICHDHCCEIHGSMEFHVYWNESSKGSYVDLGAALLEHFIFGKKIKLINRDKVEKIVKDKERKGVTKSYEHVLLKLDDLGLE